jgi:hypothetical protein
MIVCTSFKSFGYEINKRKWVIRIYCNHNDVKETQGSTTEMTVELSSEWNHSKVTNCN